MKLLHQVCVDTTSLTRKSNLWQADIQDHDLQINPVLETMVFHKLAIY
jgi:hypothetical protein